MDLKGEMKLYWSEITFCLALMKGHDISHLHGQYTDMQLIIFI